MLLRSLACQFAETESLNIAKYGSDERCIVILLQAVGVCFPQTFQFVINFSLDRIAVQLALRR